MKPDLNSDNPYKVLGVRSNSTIATIKKAWKKLCLKHHPDKGGSDEDIKKINEAYEFLKDSNKRAHYDKTGEKPGRPQSMDAKAANVIAKIFGQWCDKNEQLARAGHNFEMLINVDVFKMIDDGISNEIKELNNAIIELEGTILRFETLLNRCEGGFANVVQFNIKTAQNTIDKDIKPKLELMNSAQEMLNDGSWVYIFEEERTESQILIDQSFPHLAVNITTA